jgi:hypothetical protein
VFLIAASIVYQFFSDPDLPSRRRIEYPDAIYPEGTVNGRVSHRPKVMADKLARYSREEK